MDCYKLHTGMSVTYEVSTKEDFELRAGKNKDYYYIGRDGVKRGLAVCPACDNPVRILGLYNKLNNRKPHARHHNMSTAFAIHDESAYYHCPLSNPNQESGRDEASKNREPSAYEKSMYYMLRDYFDKAIYILNQDLSIRVSFSFAKRLLEEFVINKGYMNPDASIYNLPWILLDSNFSFNMIQKQVKRDTELHDALLQMDRIRLEPYKYKDKNGNIVETEYDTIYANVKEYVVLRGHFIQHIRRIRNDCLEESIGFGISDSEEIPIRWVHREKYGINPWRFPNLCKNGIDKYRNERFLKAARDIMPDL